MALRNNPTDGDWKKKENEGLEWIDGAGGGGREESV